MKKQKVTAFDIVLLVFMVGVVVVTLYPFLNILAISLNDATDTTRGGLHIYPREFTWANYSQIFGGNDRLLSAFGMSVLRTVVGTITGILASTMLAYTLSRRDFVFNNLFSFILVITMFISGGLIPEFLLIRELGLMNNFLVYILPLLLNAFNVIVIRSFMDNIPMALTESAKIDGANDFTIFWKIVIPLSLPVIATVSLFLAVGQWNNWFDTYLYARGNANLSTLQFELMKILDNTQLSSGDITSGNAEYVAGQTNPQSIQMAITIIATVPILMVYPFLQRYFVTGLTLGAVKS
ncbi:carbohydrate ABC transporter membrane protein 2 (CUT1 family) [Streptohalobacillus salinus]|uniref:Carbohydrate ABC transporter membrane protein 2 (CUT1 family) n=1 Tax=Streptohalobacillus salinus TaxID=621096 RepID=A0A2V3WEI5_9BACI|nr:carbohydrate ABC transporter permease [Streptohalobacillus salinus]PXW91498.1 carbohydrate ABC transporter membrane protein 2 (CUT1 family) [Streptohalobacillus salinus]